MDGIAHSTGIRPPDSIRTFLEQIPVTQRTWSFGASRSTRMLLGLVLIRILRIMAPSYRVLPSQRERRTTLPLTQEVHRKTRKPKRSFADNISGQV